jgi:hypothetical protein
LHSFTLPGHGGALLFKRRLGKSGAGQEKDNPFHI